MALAQPSRNRYYFLNSKAPFEEDGTHEFKGHKNISSEEIPASCRMDYNGMEKMTRTPASRAINGFLNSGREGTVYLGIVDDGTVKGLNLTQYQKDHVWTSVNEVLSRYTPEVENHRWSVHFIPVVAGKLSEQEIEDMVRYDPTKNVDKQSRLKPHLIRSSSFCWCDKDAVARKNNGQIPLAYVIEIRIKAWDPTDTRNKHATGEARLCPLHEDETGTVWIRKQASTTSYMAQEIPELSRQMVSNHYKPQIDRLRQQLRELRHEVSANLSRAARTVPDVVPTEAAPNISNNS